MRYYIITFKNKPLGESGEACKSDYDLSNACKDCGTGAKLFGNLRVKGISNIKRDYFETLDGDILISKNIYSQIRNSFNDFKLKQVLDLRNRELDYYHFTSKVALPKFNDNSTGFVIDRQCQTCKRNGYFSNAKIGNLRENIPTVVHPYILRYQKDDFDNLKPELIFETWERLGLSNKVPTDRYVIRYARPLTIVSEKIKDIFDRVKLKDIEYEQIIVE